MPVSGVLAELWSDSERSQARALCNVQPSGASGISSGVVGRTLEACPESLARTSRIAAIGNRFRGGSRCSLKWPNTRPSKANIFFVDAAEIWTADVNKGGREHLCAGCSRGTECSVRSESVELRLQFLAYDIESERMRFWRIQACKSRRQRWEEWFGPESPEAANNSGMNNAIASRHTVQSRELAFGNVHKDVWLLSLGEALGPAGAAFLLGLGPPHSMGGIAHGLELPSATHFVGGISSRSASNNSGINTVIAAVCGRTPVSGVDHGALLALKMLAKVGLGNTKRCGAMSEREASDGAKHESMACFAATPHPQDERGS